MKKRVLRARFLLCYFINVLYLHILEGGVKTRPDTYLEWPDIGRFALGFLCLEQT